MRGRAVTLASAALLGLASCGGEPSAEEQLCSDLEGLSDSVTELQDFDVSAGSADELATAVGDVTTQAGEVVDAAQDVARADVSELQTSVQAVTTAVSEIPANGVEPVHDALASLQETRTSLSDSVGCDDGS